MGFNTAVIICNDQLHDLAKDPDAGQVLQDVILDTIGGPPRSRGLGDANYGRYGIGALPPKHADDGQLVLIGRNSIQLVGVCWTRDPAEALKQVADQLGYTLHKKPKRKTK